MSIQSTELRYYKSAIVGDTDSNGDRMSALEIAEGVKNNVWPNVPQAERVAGSTKYRKIFVKVANDDDLTLIDPRLFVENPTPGDDRVLIFPGTQTDTQVDLTGSERLYGCGWLDADVTVGATVFDVNVEAAADALFQDGDLVRISDKASVDAGSGNVEFVRLADPGGVTWNGDKATLTLAAGQSLSGGYSAANTRVASVIEPGDIKATSDGWLESSGAGTYDETTYPVITDSISSIEQTWTLTFTDATNFTCVGDVLGSVGGGSIGGGDFAPNNADFSKPYFTLVDSGWGGIWASGDTVTFTTHPAASSIWWKRIVPAGATSLSANKVVVAITGEST